MSEPPRLLDETDDEFVAGLLRAAQQQAPRRSSVNKTLLALGTSASLFGGHAAAAAGPSALVAPLVKLAAKWVLIGGVTVGTLVTVVEFAPSADTNAAGTTQTPYSPRRAPKDKSHPAHPVPPAPVAVGTRTAPTNAEAVESQRALPVERRSLPVERRSLPVEQRALPVERRAVAERRAGAAQPPGEQLEQEVALLDRAAQALNNHAFEQAAALADQYLARFASGRLEPEARYLKMQAQRGMGDRSGASDEARRLLQVSPDGPHARAAREMQSE